MKGMKLHLLALALLAPCFAATMGGLNKDKVLGNPNAPLQLELYSDFSCPACKNFHEHVLPELMREYVVPGKVSIISREFPLNIPAHRYSREAANLATAASRIGKYSQVSDALFLNQASWGASGKVWDVVANVLKPAEQTKVAALAKDPAVAAEVQADVDAGNMVRVGQTPTLIIRKGMRQFPFPGPGTDNYSLLKTLLDGLLK